MTAVTHLAAPAPRGDFRRAVRAEWTKFRTVRSSMWTLLVASALTVGVGTAVLPLRSQDYHGPAARAAETAAYEGWWFEGQNLGVLAVIILGVLVATAEYSTGTMRATLAAVPSRGRVLAAKVTCLAAVTLAAGAVQAVAAFLIGRPVLAGRGIHVALTAPDALRGLAMAALATAGAALFGLASGLIIRHTAGAIGGVVAVWFVLSALASLLPDSWSDLVRALPAHANAGMFTPHAGMLAPGPATAVFAGYVTVLTAIAAVLFVRRDA
ncbi:ABC transporter permease [Streptomyces sp. NPDC006393]|uniref:ABC transporter permease n=1 Tax=Streptomyces sp. NPDC006393 TaxID=3156763 RepID=UPI0033D07B9E